MQNKPQVLVRILGICMHSQKRRPCEDRVTRWPSASQGDSLRRDEIGDTLIVNF